MVNTSNVVYAGNKEVAKQLRFFASKQLEMLTAEMAHNDKQTGSRIVKFASGATISLSKVFGHARTFINVPIDITNIGSLREVHVLKEFGDVLFSYVKARAFKNVLSGFVATVANGEAHVGGGGAFSGNIVWRSDPGTKGVVDIVTVLGSKAGYGWDRVVPNDRFREFNYNYLNRYVFINGFALTTLPQYSVNLVTTAYLRTVKGVRYIVVHLRSNTLENHEWDQEDYEYSSLYWSPTVPHSDEKNYESEIFYAPWYEGATPTGMYHAQNNKFGWKSAGKTPIDDWELGRSSSSNSFIRHFGIYRASQNGEEAVLTLSANLGKKFTWYKDLWEWKESYLDTNWPVSEVSPSGTIKKTTGSWSSPTSGGGTMSSCLALDYIDNKLAGLYYDKSSISTSHECRDTEGEYFGTATKVNIENTILFKTATRFHTVIKEYYEAELSCEAIEGYEGTSYNVPLPTVLIGAHHLAHNDDGEYDFAELKLNHVFSEINGAVAIPWASIPDLSCSFHYVHTDTKGDQALYMALYVAGDMQYLEKVSRSNAGHSEQPTPNGTVGTTSVTSPYYELSRAEKQVSTVGIVHQETNMRTYVPASRSIFAIIGGLGVGQLASSILVRYDWYAPEDVTEELEGSEYNEDWRGDPIVEKRYMTGPLPKNLFTELVELGYAKDFNPEWDCFQSITPINIARTESIEIYDENNTLIGVRDVIHEGSS